MDSDAVIKSFVYTNTGVYFVSTIERDCSAPEAYGMRYNETAVWEWDTENRKPGKLLSEHSDARKSISVHQQVCLDLYNGTRDQAKEGE